MTAPMHIIALGLADARATAAMAWFGERTTATSEGGEGTFAQEAMRAIAEHAGLSAAAGAGVVLAIGLVALVAGARLARPMLAAIAAAGGAVLAALAPASLFAAVGADETWRIGAMVLSGVVFGAAGVALFRPAMAVSGAAAGSIAAAGVLALMTLLGAQMPLQVGSTDSLAWASSGVRDSSPTVRLASLDLASLDLTSGGGDSLESVRESAGRAAGEAMARDRLASLFGTADEERSEGESVLVALAQAGQAGWQAIPQQARLTIRVGLLAGAVIGLVFGALWPRRAAGAVASLLGSAGVVVASLSLGVVAGVGGAWSAADVACGALVAWLALAMLGALIQASRRGSGEVAPQAA